VNGSDIGCLADGKPMAGIDLIIDMRATVVNGRVNEYTGVVVLPTMTAGLAVNLDVKQ
jgi:hypothetical protein